MIIPVKYFTCNNKYCYYKSEVRKRKLSKSIRKDSNSDKLYLILIILIVYFYKLNYIE